MGRNLKSTLHLAFLAMLLVVFMVGGCTKEQESFVKKKFSLEADDENLAPLYSSNKSGLVPVSAYYLVVLNDDIDPDDVDFKSDAMTEFFTAQKDRIFKYAVKGFTIQLSSKELMRVRKDRNVKYVEQDQVMKIGGTQFTAPWGLDRIDQQGIPLSGSFTYETTGSTVDAYIFDTGIRPDHLEFTGRIKTGYNAISTGLSPDDDNGHGTHVAGILGGTKYGVAKGINLIPVKVLDKFGTGTFTQIIAGIDWAIANHTVQPAVGNVSISGPVSVGLDEAIRRAVADGIVMCVAAGNNAVDASTASPGRVTEAITVGSVTNADQWSAFSNFGTSVDILAPGTSITSAWHTGVNDINVISGTSMATPHVSGVSALYLEKFPGTAPDKVEQGLKASSVSNKITLVPAGTSNLLLNLNFAPPPPPIPNAPSGMIPANASTSQPVSLALNWDASPNTTSYGIQISTVSNFSSFVINESGLVNPTKAIVGLANGTNYYWRINASNVSGTSPWSGINSFTTIAAPVTTVPSIPVLNSPIHQATAQATSLTLAWLAVSGATSYNIQVSSNANFSTTAVNLTGVTSTNALVSNLTQGATYYWRVSASNATGVGGWSSVFSFATASSIPPPIGSILSVPILQLPADRATGISRTPILTWTPIQGAISYDLQISTATAFTALTVNLTGVPANTAQINTLLDPRKVYYWRVRASNGSSTSGWSTVRRFTTIR